MTVNDLCNSEKEMLTPKDVKAVLNIDEQTLRIAARTNPQLLGFEVMTIGSRVRIPRRPFLLWLGIPLSQIK